jgi:hypothetical protein
MKVGSSLADLSVYGFGRLSWVGYPSPGKSAAMCIPLLLPA